eukprot:IDg10606t1
MDAQCDCARRFRSGVFTIAVIALCVKLLLICTEFSTDIDVHAHWKALVYNLPLSNWYTDTSSQWTLDYPPLFAYFEYALSHIAARVHPQMLVMNQRAESKSTIYFLRLTVIATDAILTFGTQFLIRSLRIREGLACEKGKGKASDDCVDSDLHAVAFVFLAPALLLVDNIHFQYNGLPLGVLLLSLGLLVRKRCTAAVAMYAVAINLKHTLLPLAPALAITTLTILIHQNKKAGDAISSVILRRSFMLRFALVLVSFVVSFCFPGFPYGQLVDAKQLALPFLDYFHSVAVYCMLLGWKLWAVYAAADLILGATGLAVRSPSGNTTSGIIGLASPFGTLPNINPQICAGTILSVLVPALALSMNSGMNNRNAVGRDAAILAAYT